MCGIFGFAGFEEPGLLEAMSERLLHRGPDGEGCFRHPQLSMGMRRLAIIDIEGGDQPVYSEDGRVAVCYNGEIYNFLELRGELQALGHVFATRSDTEVIVHAWEAWGPAALDRFNGMFAFALFDARDESIFLARDRFGQKPLYWWREGGALVFASEVKAMLASRRVPARVDPKAIDAYLGLRYVPEPATMFEGIFTLPAAHWMRLRPGAEPEIQRYWDVQLWQGGAYRSDESYLEEMDAGFQDAVRLCMRSDVPVGAYLSSGVDSSLIVAAMRPHTERLNTYSIGFRSPIDETRQAAETARLLGTQHHEVHCEPEDLARLPKVVWQMDRPVGDALIIAFDRLAAAASQDLKVVLGGEGADEMYAGYSFHKLIQLMERYRAHMPEPLHRAMVMPFLRALPVDLLNRWFDFPAYLGQHGKARLLDFEGGYYRRDLSANYVQLKTLWSLGERQAIYAEGRKREAREDWIPPLRDAGGPFLDRLLKLQYADWMQDWSLIRQDKNTMAHSLEMRLPFLDHRLVEQAFRMPPHLKARGLADKIVERRLAGRLLPAEIAGRRKVPFFFPVEHFFEHPAFGALVRENLDPQRLRRRGYFDPAAVGRLVVEMQGREFVVLKQVVSLVILELWHRIFIDGERLW
jgi:asparagine synthase (glutamine-hydrolysing)